MKTRKLIFSICFALLLSGIGLKTSGSPLIYDGETVFVHTDRNIYIAGENIFFKLYVINKISHKLSETSSIAYLILRGRGNIPVARIRFKVDHGTAYGSIFLPDTLSSGPYQLTAFTNYMRNSGEGSFFSEEIFIANRFDKDLSALDMYSGTSNLSDDNSVRDTPGNFLLIISPDKTEYCHREKINLVIKLPGNLSGLQADVSVSVSEDAPGTDGNISICDYLSVPSRDTIPMISTETDGYTFLPEVKGEIIQGRVIDQNSREAVADACVFLSVKDTLVDLKYDYTDANGLFRFLLNDYYDGKDLIFSIKDPGGRKLKIEPGDKFELINGFEPLKNPVNPGLKDYIIKSQDIVSVQKVYQTVSVKAAEKQFNTGIACPQLYYKPSYCVYPADFMPLNDFVEISGEILPPQLRIRKINDKYVASMADEKLQMFLDQEPVVFLDGVLINDLNQIIRMGSSKIKKVEMVCTRYVYGELVFPGILAVFSTNDEIENMQPCPVSLRMRLEKYHPYSGFTTPVNEEQYPDNKPDFRQLLYWNPDVRIKEDYIQIPGFYASDHSGNYIIRVEGVTFDGNPVSATAKISVKQ